MIDAAEAALRDSALPGIGIVIFISHLSIVQDLSPFPSFPIKNAAGSLTSASFRGDP